MIKFEEHEGQLFRMLEEPVPLAPDSKLPCLVRLIQDDSRMGMFNRDTKPSRLSDFYLVARIVSNNIVVDEFMESDYSRFEIIGYPVEEGSHWWALYSAMNGKSFVHKDAKQCRIFTMFSERELRVSDGEGETVEYVEIDEFLNDAAKDGWQIYKETKPEPEQKPSTSFDVGDWVEVTARENIYQDKITFSGVEFGKPHVLARKTKTLKFDPYTGKCFDEKLCVQITRKLSHSEVVVPITISGTVRQAYNEDGTIDDEQFQLLPNGSWDGTEMFISFDALDSHTRKLVDSLLKAQEEEK